MFVEILKILLTAGLSGAFAWWITVKSFEKQKQTTYLEEQISKFYGPVYFKLKALQKVKSVMDSHWDQAKREHDHPTQEVINRLIDLERSLISERVMPLNEEVEKNIYAFGHLVDEKEVEEDLVDFIKYAVNYEYVMKCRIEGRTDASEAYIRFPEKLVDRLELAWEAKRKAYNELISKRPSWPFSWGSRGRP